MYLFAQENDEGNIEYKCIFNIKSKDRLDRYITQLNYRINEGQGEAIYLIGVSDLGQVIGLSDEIIEFNIDIITYMSKKLKSSISLIIRGQHKGNKFLIIKIKSDNYQFNLLC